MNSWFNLISGILIGISFILTIENNNEKYSLIFLSIWILIIAIKQTKEVLMFKKLSLTLLAVFIIAGNVFASEVNKTIIDAVTLDDSPTLVTSDTIFVQDYKKVGFFVNYDETQVGNTISGAVTTQYSYDGTNWISGYFNDFAGGSTLQTSETISSDGWYYLWIDPDLEIPFARVIVTGTNTDSDDTIVLSTYLVGEK